jgi:Transposase
MAAVAKLIQRHLPNLLTYLRHHLTSAGLEAVNAVIQWVKKTARVSATPSTSRPPSTFTVVAWISPHTKAGRALTCFIHEASRHRFHSPFAELDGSFRSFSANFPG